MTDRSSGVGGGGFGGWQSALGNSMVPSRDRITQPSYGQTSRPQGLNDSGGGFGQAFGGLFGAQTPNQTTFSRTAPASTVSTNSLNTPAAQTVAAPQTMSAQTVGATTETPAATTGYIPTIHDWASTPMGSYPTGWAPDPNDPRSNFQQADATIPRTVRGEAPDPERFKARVMASHVPRRPVDYNAPQYQFLKAFFGGSMSREDLLNGNAFKQYFGDSFNPYVGRVDIPEAVATTNPQYLAYMQR